MKLRFTVQATADLTSIAEYIHERNPAAASKVRDSILASLSTLTLFQRIGRRQSIPNVRKIVTRMYGYLVYYGVDIAADEVVILAIQHPSRRRRMDDV